MAFRLAVIILTQIVSKATGSKPPINPAYGHWQAEGVVGSFHVVHFDQDFPLFAALILENIEAPESVTEVEFTGPVHVFEDVLGGNHSR